MDTPDSPDSIRPGGLAEQIIETVISFSGQEHYNKNISNSRRILTSTVSPAPMDSSTAAT